jgi:hypothetical protein
MFITIDKSGITNKTEETFHQGVTYRYWCKGYFYYDSAYYLSDTAGEFIEKLISGNKKEAIKELNGIFQCILIDETEKKVFLINDRFGFYQLFYHYTNEMACISDDFWKLTTHFDICELDETSALEFLQFRYVSGKYTLAKDIFCLEPSSFLEITYNSQITINREEYWQFRYQPKEITLFNAEEKIYTCLNDIIARFNQYLFKNKIVGISLSGGLDTRYVLALLLKNGVKAENIKSFTYGSPTSQDIRFACQLAKAAGIEHKSILFEDDFSAFFSPDAVDACLHEIGCYSYYFPAYGSYRSLASYNNVDFLLSGYDGFYMGLKASEALFNLKNQADLIQYIYKLNSTILTPDECQQLLKRPYPNIKDSILHRINEQYIPSLDPVSNFYNWTIKNRNRKYLLGVYGMQNRNTSHLLTFYDYRFMDLMESLPPEILMHERPYINSMFRKAFTGNMESFAKIPTDQRGIFQKKNTDYVAPRKHKYTLNKLFKKLFNTFDRDYAYPIRREVARKKVFSSIIHMMENAPMEFLNKKKLLSYIHKHKKSEYFTRYGLLVLISIVRMEKLIKQKDRG